MSTAEINKLSGSTDGKQIKVTGTGTGSSVTVHTAVSGTTHYDSVWLYATNSNSTAVQVTIEWGGTADPDDLIEKTIPGLGSAAGDGRLMVVDGEILRNGLAIKAFASVANVIKLSGHITEIRKS